MLGLGRMLSDLSKYSDEEYDDLVWQAKGRRGDALWLIPGLVGSFAAGIWGAIAAVMMARMVKAGGSVAPPSLVNFAVLNLVVCLTIGVAAGGTVRWVLIVRSIRRLLNKAGCPYCEFSLVGLRVDEGAVQCPECGERVVLREHKMTEDDIIRPGTWYRPIEGAGTRGAYLEPGVAETRAKPPPVGRTTASAGSRARPSSRASR